MKTRKSERRILRGERPIVSTDDSIILSPERHLPPPPPPARVPKLAPAFISIPYKENRCVETILDEIPELRAIFNTPEKMDLLAGFTVCERDLSDKERYKAKQRSYVERRARPLLKREVESALADEEIDMDVLLEERDFESRWDEEMRRRGII